MTLNSENGDVIGDGRAYTWLAGGEVTIHIAAHSRQFVDFEAYSPKIGDFDLNFHAPKGKSLAPGRYAGTDSAPIGKQAGFSVDGITGCTQGGRFVILDMTSNLSRFRALYESHCDGVRPGVFGEISYREPASAKNVLLAADRVIWRAELPGRTGRLTPITVINRSGSATRVTRVSVTSGGADFRLRKNTCRLIPAHAVCLVWLDFAPSRTGQRVGTLTVHGTRGNFVAQLGGYGLRGHTVWTMRSDRGDVIGAGRRYRFTQKNSTVFADGDDTRVGIAAVSDHGIAFTAEFDGIPGHRLTTGQRFPRAKANSDGTHGIAEMHVQSGNRYCLTSTGAFTVRKAVYRGGHVVQFSLAFVQRCEKSHAGLHGSIDYEVVPEPATFPAWATITR